MEQIIFHGGCNLCESQKLHGLARCTGCQYFEANWDLPDLNTNHAEKNKELNLNRELAKIIKNLE